jgi:hypothetical protein
MAAPKKKPTLETIPAEIHSQIFSYLSTATLGPNPWFMRIEWVDTHVAWNEISIHPLKHLSTTSKTLRQRVEDYCKHRLQHLLRVRPPGMGPQMTVPMPYCIYYIRYMAEQCTFCYEPVRSDCHGAVDFTIPVCWDCKPNFPLERILIWEIAQQEFELPLEELKANCVWAPIKLIRYFGGRRFDLNTYVFDDRDVVRYIKRCYGDVEAFFAAIAKKDWEKELELERMATQRRWAREEIERRMTAAEAMVEQYIAEHEEMEKERLAKQKMSDELVARTGRREEMFHGLMKTFLDEAADPGGRCDQTRESDSERFEQAAHRVSLELLDCEQMIRHTLKIEEEVARDRMIQHFREYMKEQATADVLLKYGLDSLFEPLRIRKHRRQRPIDY